MNTKELVLVLVILIPFFLATLTSLSALASYPRNDVEKNIALIALSLFVPATMVIGLTIFEAADDDKTVICKVNYEFADDVLELDLTAQIDCDQIKEYP